MKFSWESFAVAILCFAAGLLGAAVLSIVTQNLLGLRPESSAFIWIVLPVCTSVYGYWKHSSKND